MSRRKPAVKKKMIPDPVYHDIHVSAFTNVIMRHGKKTLAQKIIYSALTLLMNRLRKEKGSKEEEESIDHLGTSANLIGEAKNKKKDYSAWVKDVFQKILANVSPTVEVKSRRVGGTTYQVPVEVLASRAFALAMRWIVEAAKGREEKTMSLRLSAEFYDAYLGKGASIKKRDDVHRMAKANQAFAGYRW